MTYIVYKTTNLINQKFYIGVHVNIVDDGYLGSGKLIQRAIKKYGSDNFKREILFDFGTQEEAFIKEKEIVTAELVLNENCYNLKEGGNGGFKQLNNGSEEHIKRCKEAGLIAAKKTNKLIAERRLDEEYNEKFLKRQRQKLEPFRGQTSGFMGRKHSKKTKRLIGQRTSKSQAGRGNSQFGTMWITNGDLSKKIKTTDVIPDGWLRGRHLEE